MDLAFKLFFKPYPKLLSNSKPNTSKKAKHSEQNATQLEIRPFKGTQPPSFFIHKLTQINLHSYEWYLNGEILDSSSDSIEIENIPYQLDTENLKCVCQNKIGKGFGDVQLNIQCKYIMYCKI